MTGGTTPFTFTVSNGSLPAGLSLNASTGALTGTPTSSTGSPFSFTITATDASGAATNQVYTVVIDPALTVTTTTLPGWTVGQSYSQAVAVTGGIGAHTFAVTAGGLPPGLSLNDTSGVLSGTPTTTSTSPYSFTVTATDAAGVTASASYSVTINADPTLNATLPNWNANQPYSATVAGSGGTAPFTFTVTTGALPAGLSLNTSTAAITGTPTTTGFSSFTVTDTDAAGVTASASYSITITAVLTLHATLPNWTINQLYSATAAGTGGTGQPFTFALASRHACQRDSAWNTEHRCHHRHPNGRRQHVLPLCHRRHRRISASSQQGLHRSRIRRDRRRFVPPLCPTGPWVVLDTYDVGIGYGGTPPITFAVTAGALPTGLSLNTSSGAITGTPSTEGTFAFTLTNTDAAAGQLPSQQLLPLP